MGVVAVALLRMLDTLVVLDGPGRRIFDTLDGSGRKTRKPAERRHEKAAGAGPGTDPKAGRGKELGLIYVYLYISSPDNLKFRILLNLRIIVAKSI